VLKDLEILYISVFKNIFKYFINTGRHFKFPNVAYTIILPVIRGFIKLGYLLIFICQSPKLLDKNISVGIKCKRIRKEVAGELFVKYLKSFGIREDIINEVFDKVKYFLDEIQDDKKNIITSLKKGIALLENKKFRIEELVIEETFTKDVYHRKNIEVETEILSKKIMLNDYEEGIFKIDELIDFAKKFLINLSSLWMNMDNSHKRDFQEMLFPEGIYLENNEFRTTQINPVLRLIQDQNNCENTHEFCLVEV
jgi:hypothetical protein